MKEQKPETETASTLRERAEELARMTGRDLSVMSVENVHRLVQELQVHQIELEMQNEELRKTQLELEASRDQYVGLYDFAPIGYLTLDSIGTILNMNLTTASLLEVERTRLIHMKLSSYIAPADTGAFYMHLQRVLADEVKHTCELQIRKHGGAVFYARLESVGVQDEEGNINHCRTALFDITEHKKFEEERLQARNLESIGLLAGGIAHDFNNLLTAVLGNLELFRSSFPPEAEGFHLLTRVEHASLRARDLTHQLLTFAKGGAPIKTTASISDLIKESGSFVLRGSNIRCEFRISDNLWSVEIDEGQISQVIQNVVMNAQQAMPEGGVITICCDPVMIGPDPTKHFLPLHEGSYLKISILDQGTGISADALPKIFAPYFTTKPKGSGLGLASAYSIIKNHLGHMTVESELGVGTTFSIFLPANPYVQMMGKQEESIIQAGNGKILIMDDEPTIRAVLGEMLHLCGYEWEAAKNGTEAITLYQQAKDSKLPYAMVVLDLTVPGEKGGKEVIKGLLQIDPQVKAIVVSGYSNDPVMADFRTFGFSGVVSKPFRLTELSQAVHQVITGSTK